MIITKTSFFTKLSIFMTLSAGFQPSVHSMSSLSQLEGRGGWGAALWGGCAVLAGYVLYQRFSTPLPDSELVAHLGATDVTCENISQLIGRGYTQSALHLVKMAEFRTLRQKIGSSNLFTQALNLGYHEIALAILAKVPKIRDARGIASSDFGLLKAIVFPDLPSDAYVGKGLLYTAIKNSKTNSDLERVRFLVKYNIAGCASDQYAEKYAEIQDAIDHAGPTVPAGVGKDVELEIGQQQKKIRSEINHILGLPVIRSKSALSACRVHSRLSRRQV